MSDHVVIVGGSHAGVSVADNLRKIGFDEPITMVCGENELPYQRPPLSKAYMSGAMTLDRLHLRPTEWYENNRVELRLGQKVTSIARDDKRISVSDNLRIYYDKLVLATGARPRILPENMGRNLRNVHVMRDLRDANSLMDKMQAGKNLVVIGGGYIGLEAAAEAAKKGLNVTVVEAAPRILQRVACTQTSDAFRALHKAHGVTILEDTQLLKIDDLGSGECRQVHLTDGLILPAEIVIVGIGVTPRTELADDAGLQVLHGIVVDIYGRTSDPDIFACGDCTILPYEGQPTRLESVQNANDQGAAVAANIAGNTTIYKPEPWFWSDQYDMKLQIAGLNRGYDHVVVRPGKREGSVSHFYFLGDRFLAVDCLNDGATYVMSRRILSGGAGLSPAQASDSAFDLKSAL